jgi:hypothetical protein
MMTCNHTENALRSTGSIWGRYFDGKSDRGVWEVCPEESRAWEPKCLAPS